MQVFLTRRGRQSLCVFVIVVVYKWAYTFFNIFTNFFVAQHLHVIMPTAIERVTTRLKTRERERQLHVHTLSCIFIWTIACLVCAADVGVTTSIHFYFLFFWVPVVFPFPELQLHADHVDYNCISATRLATARVGIRLQFMSTPELHFYLGYSLSCVPPPEWRQGYFLFFIFWVPVACPFTKLQLHAGHVDCNQWWCQE